MIKNLVIIEIFVIFLVGIIPGLLAYYMGGASEFEATMKGLVPNSIVMNYTIAIGLLFFGFAFVDRQFLKKTDFSNKLSWFAFAILAQVGTGVLTILRIGAGIFFCLLGLWARYEPHTLQISEVAFLAGYGVFMFVECVLIAYAHEHVQGWKRTRPQPSSLNHISSRQLRR